MDKVKILPFQTEDTEDRMKAAGLLRQAFPEAYGMSAEEEVENCLHEERIALKAVWEGELVGFIGAIPQYGETAWELHPLVVHEKHRGRGIGRALIIALEEVVASQGGITLYLGSDDESFATSLGGTDLYEDTWEKIRTIVNHGHHPFSFYERMGYKIVGVIPDANGYGKPDIWMAKRIRKE